MTTDNRTNGQIVAKALVAHCEEHKMPFPRGSVKKIVEALRVAGRLAGEPTEAQVEAAARVIWEMDNTTLGISPPESLEAWEYETEGYLELARAVLEAAARAAKGAAPQAPPNLRRIISEALREAYSWSESTQAVYDAILPLFTAPVLPSSGVDEDACWHEANCRCVRAGNVDEDKLAEVIGSLDSGYMVDGPSVREIARAVGEWLNEGENE